jgi:hypothetical protein
MVGAISEITLTENQHRPFGQGSKRVVAIWTKPLRGRRFRVFDVS